MKTVGMLAVVLLGGMTAAACAQGVVPDCTPGQDSTAEKPCKAVSAAERFPFPGATSSAPAAPAVNAPGRGAAPDAPAPSSGVPAAKRFPFPGDASSSSSSSSADSSSSSDSSSNSNNSDSSSSAANAAGDSDKAGGDAAGTDTPTLKDKGSAGGKRQKAQKVQTPDQRVDEDLQVGNFYRTDENYAGAYLRAKDAYALEPNDAEVNLLYAQVALKLGKKDEALEHYRAYLKIDPKAKKAAEAEEAIEELTSSKQ